MVAANLIQPDATLRQLTGFSQSVGTTGAGASAGAQALVPFNIALRAAGVSDPQPGTPTEIKLPKLKEKAAKEGPPAGNAAFAPPCAPPLTSPVDHSQLACPAATAGPQAIAPVPGGTPESTAAEERAGGGIDTPRFSPPLPNSSTDPSSGDKSARTTVALPAETRALQYSSALHSEPTERAPLQVAAPNDNHGVAMLTPAVTTPPAITASPLPPVAARTGNQGATVASSATASQFIQQSFHDLAPANPWENRQDPSVSTTNSDGATPESEFAAGSTQQLASSASTWLQAPVTAGQAVSTGMPVAEAESEPAGVPANFEATLGVEPIVSIEAPSRAELVPAASPAPGARLNAPAPADIVHRLITTASVPLGKPVPDPATEANRSGPLYAPAPIVDVPGIPSLTKVFSPSHGAVAKATELVAVADTHVTEAHPGLGQSYSMPDTTTSAAKSAQPGTEVGFPAVGTALRAVVPEPQADRSESTTSTASPSGAATPLTSQNPGNQQVSPQTVEPQPPPASNPASTISEVSGAGPVQLARLVESASQSEMHVGLITQTFGNVDVHTALRDTQLRLAVSSERGDLRGFFAPEMPALQTVLSRHDLRIDQIRFLEPAGGQSPGFSGDADPQRHSSSQRSVSLSTLPLASDVEPEESAPYELNAITARSLNVHA